MPVNHKEIAFEDAIEHHLLTHGGYTKGNPETLDRERAIEVLRHGFKYFGKMLLAIRNCAKPL